MSHSFGSNLINLFLINRGPFPSFLNYIGKYDSPNCICSGYGDALHYAWDCSVTKEYHFVKLSLNSENIWLSNLIKYTSNKTKICRLVKWLSDNESFLRPV